MQLTVQSSHFIRQFLHNFVYWLEGNFAPRKLGGWFVTLGSEHLKFHDWLLIDRYYFFIRAKKRYCYIPHDSVPGIILNELPLTPFSCRSMSAPTRVKSTRRAVTSQDKLKGHERVPLARPCLAKGFRLSVMAPLFVWCGFRIIWSWMQIKQSACHQAGANYFGRELRNYFWN